MRAILDRLLLWLARGAIARERRARRAERFTPGVPCAIAGCAGEAVHFARWGAAGEQCGNLCETHLGEVWGRCQNGVAAGRLSWEQSMPRPEYAK